MQEFTISPELLQAIYALLSALPASQSRGVLNALDEEIARQSQAAQAQARAQLEAQIRADMEVGDGAHADPETTVSRAG